MGMDYKVEHIHDDGEIHKERVEGDFTWGGSLRYYAKDNMFVEGGLKMGDGYDDPDSYLAGGVSLKLGFDDKLWFEPMIKYNMPGAEISTEEIMNLSQLLALLGHLDIPFSLLC